MTDVKVGLVWADNDKRSKGRTVTVVALLKQYDPIRHTWIPKARVLDNQSQRTTEIRIDRFRPTASGYRLVSQGGE